MKIKQGDTVRVSEDAPKIYTDGWRFDWRNSDSIASIIENEDAVISPDDSGEEELTIPTKYLVKVDAEAKEAKFKRGDRVRIIKQNHPQYGKTATVDTLVRGAYPEVLVNLGGNLISFDKSDLEPYTELTERTEAEKKPNHTIKIPVEVDLSDGYWDAYAADLAKEVVLKTVNSASDRRPSAIAEYAVSVAKAVVEGLKRK